MMPECKNCSHPKVSHVETQDAAWSVCGVHYCECVVML